MCNYVFLCQYVNVGALGMIFLCVFIKVIELGVFVLL